MGNIDYNSETYHEGYGDARIFGLNDLTDQIWAIKRAIETINIYGGYCVADVVEELSKSQTVLENYLEVLKESNRKYLKSRE